MPKEQRRPEQLREMYAMRKVEVLNEIRAHLPKDHAGLVDLVFEIEEQMRKPRPDPPVPTNRRFARFRTAKEAIQFLLVEHGRPLRETEIVYRLIFGGYAEGDEKNPTNIRQLITRIEQGKEKELKAVRGWYGLSEWADGKFPS